MALEKPLAIADAPEAVLRKRKDRLKSDKTVTVRDIEEMFEEWMTIKGSRDINGMLHNMEKDMTWKTTANAALLGDQAELYRLIADKFKTGVMPSRFTALALEACDRHRRCNFGDKRREIWGSDHSALIRCGLAKYRDLAEDVECRETCFRKALISFTG